MQVKEIEGVRVKPGETLVLVPDRPLSMEEVNRLFHHTDHHGIKVLILPHGSKLYVKENDNG